MKLQVYLFCRVNGKEDAEHAGSLPAPILPCCLCLSLSLSLFLSTCARGLKRLSRALRLHHAACSSVCSSHKGFVLLLLGTLCSEQAGSHSPKNECAHGEVVFVRGRSYFS